MESHEILITVKNSLEEIAALMRNKMTEVDMMMDDNPVFEQEMTINYQKGYSAAIHDVVNIMETMAAKIKELG